MKRLFAPSSLLALGLVLLVVAGFLYVYPSNEYIFLPDKPHPVAPLITIRGGHDPTKGGVYFVDIVIRKATLLERLFGGLHDGAQLVPASAVNPPERTTHSAGRSISRTCRTRRRSRRRRASRRRQERRDATGRRAGRRVEAGLPAAGKIQPADVIVAVAGNAFAVRLMSSA